MTVKVHVMQGLPASGKSTFAKELGVLRFNLDDLRVMLGFTTHEDWDTQRENSAIRIMEQGILSAVKSGRDIVIDNTHLTKRLPDRYRKLLAMQDVEFIAHVMDTDVNVCCLRDIDRKVPVGGDAIRKMARKTWVLTTEWLNDGLCKTAPYKVPTEYLRSAIICDLDGTLMMHTSGRSPYDGDRCGEDSCDEVVYSILHSLRGVRVIFLSGRSSKFRPQTEKWLEENIHEDIMNDSELYMRAEDDLRPDYVVKGELFDAHVRDRFHVFFALDDRNQVVDLWRKIGLKCLQVATGDF